MSNRPMLNIYICEDGHKTVTVDVNEGVTPFMIDCKKEGCDLTATSRMYPVGLELKDAEWEWYSPSPAELKKMDQGMFEHCRQGGLDLRKRTEQEPAYHKE